MHGVTGLDVLAGLRETDWATPVILLTAFGDAELHAEAHRLGALAVFDKPFDFRDLRKLARTVAGS
jgi:FixJ family two-component response regulator